MRPFLLLLAGVLAIALGTRDSGADSLDPVFVTVAGQGAIQVRLTAGNVTPCDSSDNEPVFDGWLQPGTWKIMAPRGSVCMQHTFGESREGEWSTPAVLFTTSYAWRRRGSTPLRIRLSTETPYR